MLTKSRCSSKTGWWLEMDGRPMAKFVRGSDVDDILGLQDRVSKNESV